MPIVTFNIWNECLFERFLPKLISTNCTPSTKVIFDKLCYNRLWYLRISTNVWLRKQIGLNDTWFLSYRGGKRSCCSNSRPRRWRHSCPPFLGASNLPWWTSVPRRRRTMKTQRLETSICKYTTLTLLLRILFICSLYLTSNITATTTITPSRLGTALLSEQFLFSLYYIYTYINLSFVDFYDLRKVLISVDLKSYTIHRHISVQSKIPPLPYISFQKMHEQNLW